MGLSRESIHGEGQNSYGEELAKDTRMRTVLMVCCTPAFVAAAAARLFGVLMTKSRPDAVKEPRHDGCGSTWGKPWRPWWPPGSGGRHEGCGRRWRNCHPA
jgi:hypothetical protein